jgi:acetyltransferase
MVGASARGKWPGVIIRNLREGGYPGRLFFVNPGQRQVFGSHCYPSPLELPEPAEHALVIVPSRAVPGVLTDAEAAGIKSATVYSARVGEGDDPESKKRGRWLEAFLSQSKLRLAGPNCMGSMSYRERLFAYPNAELYKVPAGPVGVIFQSGGTLQFFMKSAADRGLRFSYGISSGNEADLDLADYLKFLVDDDATRQIVLFIEGIRRPAAFMQAAASALERGKQILAIKTGMTQKSQSAALSHTGAIAGDHAAYLAMCDRYGIINCRSLDDLLETTLAFQCGRRSKGPRIGIVTTSGGTVDLLHDYVESEGAVLAEFSDETCARLKPLLQEGIEPKNPIDAGIPSTLTAAAGWCRAVLDDANVDMLAWAGQLPRKKSAWPDVSPLRQLVDGTDRPVIAFGRMRYQVTPESIELQEAAGLPFLQGLEATLRALNALWFHAERQGSAPVVPPPAPASSLTPETLGPTLAQYGIVLANSRLVADAAQAGAAAEAIGFPVALKIQSSAILHKTEAGGVILDLRSRQEVERGAQELLDKMQSGKSGARIDGILVQEMVSGLEAIVGARSDPLYGPMLMVGSGGILAELVRDAQIKLVPVTPSEVRAMVDRLRLARLLSGHRNRPAADRPALEAAALALARFFLDHRARVSDVEINPLMVRPEGCGAVAVDVRVLWQDGVSEVTGPQPRDATFAAGKLSIDGK